jgi:hypothetical protein
MDFPRIFARLRFSRKYGIPVSHVMLLHKNLHGESITGIEHPRMVLLQEQAAALLDLYQRLEYSPLPQQNLSAYEYIEGIVKLGYNLGQSTGFAATLGGFLKLNSRGKTALRGKVAKLGQYYKASSQLVLAARCRRCRIFLRIRVGSS